MEQTFRNRIISKCMEPARKNRLLKYPCLGLVAVLLPFYYLCMYFSSNGKRYAGVIFSFLFFMSSCSFSFAVFSDQTGFINPQETYNAIVEDSDVVLAVYEEPDPENAVVLEAGLSKEYEDSENIENMDFYTLDDILDDTYTSAEAKNVGQMESPDENMIFDSSDWRLVLINKQHPIADNYEVNLGKINTIKGTMYCDERIVNDYLAMLQAAKKDGRSLAVLSPYRNDDRQEYLFDRKIQAYMRQGFSYMDAYKTASQAVTIPGASEHQVGLALDIVSNSYTTLDEGFADTSEGKWLAEHSYEYGFVLRYPKGKEYITSIEYEPWHFRYVGKEAAAVMKNENICLEEFWDKYL